jgi:hypothetical protein
MCGSTQIKGTVNGISGNVDMNIAYRDFAPKPKKFPGTLRVLVDPMLNLRDQPTTNQSH